MYASRAVVIAAAWSSVNSDDGERLVLEMGYSVKDNCLVTTSLKHRQLIACVGTRYHELYTVVGDRIIL